MKSIEQIQEIANKLYAEVTEKLNAFHRNIEITDTKDDSRNTKVIQGYIDGVMSIIKGVSIEYDGETISLPRYYCNIEGFIDDYILISFKSVINVRPRTNKTIKFLLDNNISTKIEERTLSILFEMYYMEMAKLNLADLNKDLRIICQQAGVNYTFGFGFDPNNSNMVLSITDDEIIFNATHTAALNIKSNPLYAKGSELDDILANNERNMLRKSLQTVQTTVQLIKGNIKIVELMTGVNTRTRASKILRHTYHRQVKNFDTVKQACIGYFNETVDVNGEPTEIFAIVKKEKDNKDGSKGAMTVVLHPFDVKTNYVVDYDVLNHKYN